MSEARVDSAEEPSSEWLDPADAFALLGSELRIEILRALWAGPEQPVAFSELYRAVDVDDSAHFNYHLEKLTDHFVRRTEDGYVLRRAGEKVVQAVLEGSFTQHPHRSIAIEDPCIRCGEQLEATYEDESLSIDCPACGHGHGTYPFPPGGLNDRTDAEILDAFDQRVRHLHCLAKDGVCPECNGKMHTSLIRDRECCLGASLRAEHACEQCGHTLCATIGLGLVEHSAVVSFYSDHGIDLGKTPYWRLDWCVSDDGLAVRSEEPWRITVEIELDGEVLSVTVDEDLAVVSSERTDAPGSTGTSGRDCTSGRMHRSKKPAS